MSERANAETISPIFVHSSLDDYGLTASEFRVLAHVSRRAGKGECNASVPNMAKVCKLEEKTIRKALSGLVEAGLLAMHQRIGLPTVYTMRKISEWKERTLPKEHQGCRTGSVAERVESLPKRHQAHPTQTAPDKGNPLQGNPIKVIQSAALQFPLHLQSEDFQKAWSEWTEYYPKRVKGKRSHLAQTYQKQIDATLSALSEAEAIKAINRSIANSWQGLFPPKSIPNSKPKPQPQTYNPKVW
jgi:hypothetical protein